MSLMKLLPRIRLLIVLAGSVLLLSSCGGDKSGDLEQAALPVGVVAVKQQSVPLYLDYVGQTGAISEVDIRARVEGFLQEKGFVEGEDVKEEQMIYIIDPRPFEASLESAKGDLLRNQASADYAAKEEARMAKLVEDHVIPQEQYDQSLSQKEAAEAAVMTSQADVETAELNLSYTTMYAPFAGRIGQKYVDVGNLVGAGGDQTILATIVQLDPIYALFSPKASDLPRIMEQLHRNESLNVVVTINDDTEQQYQGKVDFIDNRVSVNTSTILLRAVLANSDEVLLPGIYVNVRLLLGEDENAMLVPQEAVMEGQGNQYVYIVDKDDKTQQQIVISGAVYQGKRIVYSGLAEGDLVIVEGLQNMQTGISVKTHRVDETDDTEKDNTNS